MGASLGSTLALVYAEAHPNRITAMILFGITTGTFKELDWRFRGGIAIFFPEQWGRLLAGVPPELRNSDIVEAYSRLLNDSDIKDRQAAARNCASGNPHLLMASCQIIFKRGSKIQLLQFL
jgi:proline iminopeptidase